jgi:hypothetical protein
MEALHFDSINQNTQPNRKEKVMNTTSTILKHGELPEHGFVKESIIIKDNRKSVKRRKLDRESRLTVIRLISSLLVVLMGIAGYWVAGLFY